MNPGTFVVRADENAAMGTGHVMRCLALAQAWQDAGGLAIFVMAEATPAIRQRLESERIPVVLLKSPTGTDEDGNELASIAHDAAWVVVDGYQFDSRYQRRVKDSGLSLLWIDDLGLCGPYCADVVLNQNAYAKAQMYPDRRRDMALLLGPRYALLRREFIPQRNWRRGFASEAKRVLVTMGGSDAHNVSALILDALQAIDSPEIEITVVIGGSNPHAELWREIASSCSSQVRVQFNVNNMPELIATADLAISAAGTSCYELALLQTPMILVTVAQNQRCTAQAMATEGAAIDAGWFDNLNRQALAGLVRSVVLDSSLRHGLGQNARKMVDGFGAERVCERLVQSRAVPVSPSSLVGAG